ncbi:hypothetical protein BOTBODRAFT_33457 [Botryobasidium botryosum FD-172 SS1]|uniref:CsbD-like domain-containing protein n=1 Tax=Botryobasidium botryosum (strain FD-172 SS1) TaxID=930990 RepID=A0A067MFH6_BOTB1|nr:hypothetical protein BOTBODRAFT_33457 [Botryobasidium botryosum FD-172 SS1]
MTFNSNPMAFMKGSAKEVLGNMVGSEQMAAEGAAQGYAVGASDRVAGKKDSVLGAVTGDKTQRAPGEAQQQKGSTQQTLNS